MIKMRQKWMFCVAAVWLLAAAADAQFIGEEKLNPLQETAVIGGETRELDNIGSTIYTNRTTTHLNCAAGIMNVDVVFNEPFFGIIYPKGSRKSACFTQGRGKKKYHIELPLKGCGTNRVERRVFVNTIIVRFHPSLELESDEVKTIICRYPSPKVILPPLAPSGIIAPAVPPAVQRVGEVEIMLIICAILFLALLLVGMACSYTCLKKRNIKLVRRRPMSLGPGSTISKISGSIIPFDGLKIPRAHATSTSVSDTATTLPSDYPSESPSDGSEIEEGELVRASSSSSEKVEVQVEAYENTAYVMEEEDRLSSVYSDAMMQSEADFIGNPQIISPPKPTFMVRVKRAATPPKTPEPDYPVQLAHAQSLTTILERDESYRAESRPGSEYALLLSESEDLNPPAEILLGPAYAVTRKKTQSYPRPPPSDIASVARSISESDLRLETMQMAKRDIHHINNIENVTIKTVDVNEIEEHTARKILQRRAPSEPESDYASEARSVTDIVEELPVVPRPPQITKHVVDDRHLSVVTETQVTEDIERHKRYVKQYHQRPKALPPPKWNVAIRHYPGPKYADDVESSGPEWETYSEPGSVMFRQHLNDADETLSQLEVEAMEHPPPHNWNVLLRVLEPPPTELAEHYVLTEEDREKWRKIVSTESTLRTMLTTATVKEDFERIRHDQRYEKLFEPKKWDVIIRILSPPIVHYNRMDSSSQPETETDTESLPSRDGRRMYRKNDVTITSRRSSLPPLYEYDAEGNPIIRKTAGPPSARSRRSSKSSISGAEVRSLAETEVNFSRMPMDAMSDASGPSMVSGGPRNYDRSHSEITYSVPVYPDGEYPDTDGDDRVSTRTGRSLARSASEFMEDWRHHEHSDRYSHVSGSSGSSHPHRQVERSVSEYFTEAPHYSESEASPPASPRITARYRTYHTDYQNQYEDAVDNMYLMQHQDVEQQRAVMHHQDVEQRRAVMHHQDVEQRRAIIHHEDVDHRRAIMHQQDVEQHHATSSSSYHQSTRGYQQQDVRRVDHRSDRSTTSGLSGREEMYSVAETEVWPTKR